MTNPRTLLSARELAPKLSSKVGTVRTWDAAGLLPTPIRIGRTVRWDAVEIDRWIAAGCPPRSAWESMRKATANV